MGGIRCMPRSAPLRAGPERCCLPCGVCGLHGDTFLRFCQSVNDGVSAGWPFARVGGLSFRSVKQGAPFSQTGLSHRRLPTGMQIHRSLQSVSLCAYVGMHLPRPHHRCPSWTTSRQCLSRGPQNRTTWNPHPQAAPVAQMATSGSGGPPCVGRPNRTIPLMDWMPHQILWIGQGSQWQWGAIIDVMAWCCMPTHKWDPPNWRSQTTEAVIAFLTPDPSPSCRPVINNC